ncbi:aspartate:proton symporter, partial [Alicyclobacillaceae bacterium I2511]
VPDASRPYRLKGDSIIAPIAFVIGSLIVYWTGWKIDSKLLIALLIGVVLYAIFSAAMPKEIERPTVQTVRSGIWMVVYLLVLLALTYLGSSTLGEKTNTIKYPWDMVVVIVFALGFYYWGVASGHHTADVDEALESVEISRDAGAIVGHPKGM